MQRPRPTIQWGWAVRTGSRSTASPVWTKFGFVAKRRRRVARRVARVIWGGRMAGSGPCGEAAGPGGGLLVRASRRGALVPEGEPGGQRARQWAVPCGLRTARAPATGRVDVRDCRLFRLCGRFGQCAFFHPGQYDHRLRMHGGGDYTSRECRLRRTPGAGGLPGWGWGLGVVVALLVFRRGIRAGVRAVRRKGGTGGKGVGSCMERFTRVSVSTLIQKGLFPVRHS